MAIEKGIKGTGITAREVTYYSGDDIAEMFRKQLGGWSEKVKQYGGEFPATAAEPMKEVRAILDEQTPEPHEQDSPEDYAVRLEKLYRTVMRELKDGNGDRAARYAFQMGFLYCEGSMKEAWEEHALRGVKQAERLRDNANRNNSQRKQEAEQRHGLWAEIAADIRARFPSLSKSAVAQAVAKRTGDNPNTIRRKI